MDITFRDIMAADDPKLGSVPFGGKLVVLGGDFRQTMPVIRRAGIFDFIPGNQSPFYTCIEKM